MGNMVADNPFLNPGAETPGNEQEKPAEKEVDPLDSPLIGPRGQDEEGEEEEGTQEEEGKDESFESEESEGAQEEESEEPEVPSSSMLEMMGSMQQKLDDMAQKSQQAQQPQRERTAEEWEQIKEQTGLTQSGVNTIAHEMKQMEQRLFNSFADRLAVMEKQSVISELSKEKGFEGIQRHSANMDKFLEKFPKNMHNNKDVLRMAALSSKGMESDKRATKAHNSTERNRKVVSRISPKGPGQIKRAPARAKSVSGLTATQRSFAATAGMSEAEYKKYMVKR